MISRQLRVRQGEAMRWGRASALLQDLVDMAVEQVTEPKTTQEGKRWSGVVGPPSPRRAHLSEGMGEITTIGVSADKWATSSRIQLDLIRLPHLAVRERDGQIEVLLPPDVYPSTVVTMAGTVSEFPISTTFDVPPYVVERTVGLCWGIIVRSVGTVKGITGGLRALRAGEVPQYTEVVDQARHTALERLIAHAQELGGNAVLGVRFDSSDVGDALSEIVAYGTAAVIRSP